MEEISTDNKMLEINFEGLRRREVPEGDSAEDCNNAAESDDNPLPVPLVRLRRK